MVSLWFTHTKGLWRRAGATEYVHVCRGLEIIHSLLQFKADVMIPNITVRM